MEYHLLTRGKWSTGQKMLTWGILLTPGKRPSPPQKRVNMGHRLLTWGVDLKIHELNGILYL